MKTIFCIFSLILLSGCGITGSIDRSEMSAPDGTVTKNCKATYSNTSWGTASDREVRGCDAGGSGSGLDNTQMIQIPLSVLKALAGGVK